MPDLDFHITGVQVVRHAAAPQLAFSLKIDNRRPDRAIHWILLRCQVRLETARRSYTPGEKVKLLDLFGEPPGWGRALQSMLWTQVPVCVTAFREQTTVDLPVPCTFDLHVASARFLDSLSDGTVPVTFLFSGTIFYSTNEHSVQICPVSWSAETTYKMPVSKWRETMEHYFPNSAWLRLRRDVYDRLVAYKSGNQTPTWEDTIEHLLANSDQKAHQKVLT